nr:hypothetical protein [Tanacetum cinerariifolium]
DYRPDAAPAYPPRGRLQDSARRQPVHHRQQPQKRTRRLLHLGPGAAALPAGAAPQQAAARPRGQPLDARGIPAAGVGATAASGTATAHLAGAGGPAQLGRAALHARRGGQPGHSLARRHGRCPGHVICGGASAPRVFVRQRLRARNRPAGAVAGLAPVGWGVEHTATWGRANH